MSYDLKVNIADKMTSLNRDIHQTFGLLVLSSTGLKHLKYQITEPYDPIKFHEVNAELEKEIRTNFSGDYMEKIVQNPEDRDKFLSYMYRIEAMRDELVEFIKEVNSK